MVQNRMDVYGHYGALVAGRLRDMDSVVSEKVMAAVLEHINTDRHMTADEYSENF